jgi:type IV pilus assembly protein PilA
VNLEEMLPGFLKDCSVAEPDGPSGDLHKLATVVEFKKATYSSALHLHFHSRPQSGFTLLELMVVIAIISIVAMVGLPTYRDYVTRARIIEDFATVKTIKMHVLEYYNTTGLLPTKNQQLGLPKDKDINGVRLEKVSIDKKPMPGTITVHFDNTELPELGNNNQIEFVPVAMNGALVWDCKSGNMADKYRPSGCRGLSPYE